MNRLRQYFARSSLTIKTSFAIMILLVMSISTTTQSRAIPEDLGNCDDRYVDCLEWALETSVGGTDLEIKKMQCDADHFACTLAN